MAKTYLINLTEAELEALTCDYLLKGCAAKHHHDDTLLARSKMLKKLREIQKVKL